MKTHLQQRQRGSVTLVAACFTAALGIAIATYVSVSSRAMNLSNRTFQTGLSQQLAEMGLEYSLQALNTNDWSSWTLDTTNRRATRAVTFSSTKFGTSGVTGSISLRIDNYDGGFRGNDWSSATSYRINDLVGHNGTWYRCVQAHTNQTPNWMNNLAYWVPEGIEWQWSITRTYRAEEIVNYNGVWYRCILAHTASSSILPTNTTYWTSIPYLTREPTFYNIHDAIVNWYGTWYRWDSSTGWDTASAIFWRWRSGYSYTYNDIVCYGVSSAPVWYRCHTPTSSALPTNTSNWTPLLNNWTWSSAYSYKIGDVVYRSGSWYRCIRAHTNQGPPNTTYWLNSPPASTAWDPGRLYSANDVMSYNGTWYLSILGSNVGQNPVTATTYWVSPSNSSYQWNSSTAYSVGTYRSYGGAWYRCVAAHTNQSPNNTTYWSAVGATVVFVKGSADLVDGPTIDTQFRGVAAKAPLFPNAAGATTTLTITGAGTVDSYNGALDSISTAGVHGTYDYNQTLSPFSGGSPNVGYSAVLAAGSTSGTALTIGTTTIKGYLAAPSSSTSPYAPLFSVGATASLKQSDGTTVTSPHSTATGVDLTRISRSVNIPQFDPLRGTSIATAFSSANFNEGQALTLPSSTGGTLNIGTAGATTPTTYHYDGTLSIGSAYVLQTLNINGPVILHLNGELQIYSGGLIEIEDTGSLELHCTIFRTHSSSHGIWNRTSDPKKLLVIADTTGSSITRLNNGNSATNRDFYGAIYAPNTTYSLGFEVRTGVTVYGAISASEITFPSEANLHYDTSLRYHTYSLIDHPWHLTDWRELTATNEKASF